jgi:hypothetical protein
MLWGRGSSDLLWPQHGAIHQKFIAQGLINTRVEVDLNTCRCKVEAVSGRGVPGIKVRIVEGGRNAPLSGIASRYDFHSGSTASTYSEQGFFSPSVL